MAPRPPELAPRLSSRLALAFGLLLLLGILASMRLWYSGLPALGIQGARAQHLEAAARVLQLSADKHLQHMTDSLREKRGDMLIVAENRVLAEALATGSTGLDRDFERWQCACNGPTRTPTEACGWWARPQQAGC